MPWPELLTAILANGAIAIVSFFLFRHVQGAGRTLAWLALTLVAAPLPALFSLENKPLRFAAALVTICSLVKLYDVFRTPEMTRRTSLIGYLISFCNPAWLVWRRTPPSIPESQNVRWIVAGVPLAILLLIVLDAVFHTDWTNRPFVLEHLAKVAVVVAETALLANIAAAVWRSLGGLGLIPMRNLLTVRTPGEFWLRWNIPAQQFFHEYVFIPAGGRRHWARGVMATFLVSGLIHEYVLGIAAGRVLGSQMAYFVLQGIAVVVWRRSLAPFGMATFSIVLALAFQIASSVLFFSGVNAILPFYSPR